MGWFAAGLFVIAGWCLMVVVRAMISDQNEWEREQSERMEQMRQELRVAPREQMGPMELYLSTGAIPNGRTAEILRFAQESHDKRGER